MFILISPAKKLDMAPNPNALPYTQPGLLRETKELMETTRQLKPSQLKNLMSISDSLAELNFERFQRFSTPFTSENAKQAALIFDGDTYVGLSAKKFSAAEMLYAQDHLGIISGLYGLLRPLDLVQPYRLEMGIRLKTARGNSLYSFWGDLITKQVNSLTEGHVDRTIVNLASHEYYKAVQPKMFPGGVVTPVFKEIRGDRAKVISFMAKRARGMMARYIIENRLETPDGLREFDFGGYSFNEDLSSTVEMVFTRASETPLD